MRDANRGATSLRRLGVGYVGRYPFHRLERRAESDDFAHKRCHQDTVMALEAQRSDKGLAAPAEPYRPRGMLGHS